MSKPSEARQVRGRGQRLTRGFRVSTASMASLLLVEGRVRENYGVERGSHQVPMIQGKGRKPRLRGQQLNDVSS